MDQFHEHLEHVMQIGVTVADEQNALYHWRLSISLSLAALYNGLPLIIDPVQTIFTYIGN